MKYSECKKDKRTKNLTLRDIHVGDWVQVWSEQTERYSPPLKIIQICDDGTIYLVTSDEERPTPWEEDIKNVDALPITLEHLRGFRFEIEMFKNGDGKLRYNGEVFAILHNCREVVEDCGGSIVFDRKTDKYFVYNMIYMHELIAYTEEELNVKIEWKGVEK